jgi:hypothetical protein
VEAENEAQTSKVCPCNNPERPGEGGGFYVLAIRQQETVLLAPGLADRREIPEKVTEPE